MLYELLHPISTFRDRLNTWGTFPWKLSQFFSKTLPSHIPGNRACRWLGNMLIGAVYNNKILDTFSCRTYGANTKYYRASCHMGRVTLYQIQYMRNNRSVNTFIDVFVTTLVDQKQGKKNAESIKVKKKIIWRGWVFRKSAAIKRYKEVVTKEKKIFDPTGKSYPALKNSWYMPYTDQMLSILHTGKIGEDTVHNYIDSTYLENLYKNSKNNIEKLWCYVTDLLVLPNDFDAHSYLANICRSCETYLYHREMAKNPEIDYTYRLTLERLGQEEANKWKNQCIRENSLKKATESIENEIYKLREYYENQDLEYYRV